jgi:hypothetical protein
VPHTLLELAPRDRDGAVRVVIESPAGSQELEEFFLSVTRFEGKDLEILGWEGAAAADRLIDRSRRSR